VRSQAEPGNERNARELATRLAKLFGVVIESVRQLEDVEAEAVSWNAVRSPAPTNTIPGTAERSRCYRERVERGERLFHTLDATCEGLLGGEEVGGEEWAVEFFIEDQEDKHVAAKKFAMGF